MRQFLTTTTTSSWGCFLTPPRPLGGDHHLPVIVPTQSKTGRMMEWLRHSIIFLFLGPPDPQEDDEIMGDPPTNSPHNLGARFPLTHPPLGPVAVLGQNYCSYPPGERNNYLWKGIFLKNRGFFGGDPHFGPPGAVSYTHLTLPTICSV